MKPLSTIPATSGWRRTIRLLNSILRPLAFMEERTQKYGDFYQVTFKNAPPTVMTSNPRAIEEILTASEDTFEVGRGNQGLKFLVGDHSLLLLDGKTHQNRRRLLMPSFHGEALQKCSSQIVETTQEITANWRINQPFKVRRVMQEITLRVILKAIFGQDSGERYTRLRELLTNLLEIFNIPLTAIFIFFPSLQKDLGRLSPWGRFLAWKKEIKTLIYEEIQERRERLSSGQEQATDILSLLLLAKDEDGLPLTDEELHDELITLLFAGHETTASALSWLFYWVHSLPEVQDKLRFELNSIGDLSDYKTINKLPYLDAVISETLRIYPIAATTFARILTKPKRIMGYDFAPKTWFMMSVYSLHHREDLYPNPKQFQPERFLQKTYSLYEYLPFGGGNRRCLGSALALLEMKLVTATILQQFQLELTSKKPMFPVRRGLTIAPPAYFSIKVKGLNN
ncbi:cytochrome P450 [Rippkaea orientalis PCC 8801]|uniref:Cytochrome P450 n=1 Tax=Rippkaea orientalis (strain PCC 8801 / RF-1) TaxID=41431 RepID=B7K028_RIPO1|nr:cytochrome P450 [Rippkaea orientalis]ACK66175.1 cytochrome P450 [Rippkaea orientalis PCC 8801]